MKNFGIVLLIAGVMFGSNQGGQDSSKQQAQRERKLAAGEREAKRLLLLMDRDKNGKVSKLEFTTFMQEEFERLDVNKDGELDVKELTQSRVVVRGRSR